MSSSSPDLNPRPAKRQRTESDSSSSRDDSSSLTELDSSQCSDSALAPLPPAILLVSLPGLLIHPPNHKHHAQSLCISLLALRRCLRLPNLASDIECRAWTALAEIGMIVIGGGFSQDDDHLWAQGIEVEVEKATSKALLIAQKHPSLRPYRSHLTFMSAQLSQWQGNTKFARTQLRRLTTTFLSSDPPHIIYSAHLTLISHLMTPAPNTLGTTSGSKTSPRTGPSTDIHAALTAIRNLENLSITNGHPRVTLLTHILRLRLLVSSGLWDEVESTLKSAEEALGLDYSPQADADPATKKPLQASNAPPSQNPTPTRSKSKSSSQIPTVSLKTFENGFDAVMAIHALIIGVVFHTYAGNEVDTTPRLTHLHFLMDGGALKNAGSGIAEITFPNSQPLFVQTTHPRILLVLAFLVSSVAKRDPVGRKPRRKIFAMEGLAMCEREGRKELILPKWASAADALDIELKMAKMKGDLMCELIGVSIMRSEFESAEQHLALLISHTRTHGLFPSFSGRITLHHAHLAHAQGNTQRALDCYRVAASIAADAGDEYVRVSARAGEVALRIGVFREKCRAKTDDEGKGKAKAEETDADVDAMDVDVDAAVEEDGADAEREWEEIDEMGREVADSAQGLGGTMRSIGKIVEACLTKELMKAKQQLKSSLELATSAMDNHLRALILALIACHYVHTAPQHALSCLGTCEQLGAGLGAAPGGGKGAGAAAKGKSKSGGKDETPVKVKDAVGNAPLRTWVGERFLEIYKRSGDEAHTRKQEMANKALEVAIARAGVKRTAGMMDS